MAIINNPHAFSERTAKITSNGTLLGNNTITGRNLYGSEGAEITDEEASVNAVEGYYEAQTEVLGRNDDVLTNQFKDKIGFAGYKAEFDRISVEDRKKVMGDVVSFASESKENLKDKAYNRREKNRLRKVDFSKKIVDKEASDEATNIPETAANAIYGEVAERPASVTVDARTGAVTLAPGDETVQRAQKDYMKKLVNDADTFEMNLRNYKDDKEFSEKYLENKLAIEKCEQYKRFLAQNPDAVKEYVGDKLADKVREDIVNKLNSYDDDIKYFNLKAKIIMSPYYSLLEKNDTAFLSEEDLQYKIDFVTEMGKHEFAAYLQNLLELKKLNLGRIKGDVRDKMDITTKGTKNSVTVARRSRFGVRYKVNRTVAERTRNHSFTVDGSTGYDAERQDPVNEDIYKPEPIDEIHEQDADDSVKGTLRDSVSVGASYNYTYTRKKVSKSVTAGGFSASGSRAYRSLSAGANVSATALKNGEFRPAFSVGGNFEAKGADFNGSLGYKLDIPMGAMGKLTGIGAEAKGNVTFGKITAKGSAEVGRIINKEGKDLGVGVKLSGKAGAFAAAAKGSISFSILGIKFTGKAEGDLGFGAKAKYTHTTGKMSLSLGVVFAIGGTVGISVDYSEFSFKAGEALVRAVKSVPNLFRKLIKRGKHTTEKANAMGARFATAARNVDSRRRRP